MQKDYLLKDLTIEEYMTSAAHLKLGEKISDEKKKSTVIVVNFKILIEED